MELTQLESNRKMEGKRKNHFSYHSPVCYFNEFHSGHLSFAHLSLDRKYLPTHKHVLVDLLVSLLFNISYCFQFFYNSTTMSIFREKASYQTVSLGQAQKWDW
jgi:hypothetical protein